MTEELYQKKYQYERFIKELETSYNKLEKCYSHLILCRRKVIETIMIDDNYYNNSEFDKIIKNLENNKNIIKDIILPNARHKLNEIISLLAEL